MSCILAMPWTTVQKMIGAIAIFIILISASPRGFMLSPMCGYSTPKIAPRAIAIRTWKYRWWYHGLRRGGAEARSTSERVVTIFGLLGAVLLATDSAWQQLGCSGWLLPHRRCKVREGLVGHLFGYAVDDSRTKLRNLPADLRFYIVGKLCSWPRRFESHHRAPFGESSDAALSFSGNPITI